MLLPVGIRNESSSPAASHLHGLINTWEQEATQRSLFLFPSCNFATFDLEF